MSAVQLLGIGFACVAAGAAVSILPLRALGRAVTYVGVGAGAAAFGASAVSVLAGQGTAMFALSPASHVALRLDPLAAAFTLIISAVAAIVAIYALGGQTADEAGDGRPAARSCALIFLASIAICTADDILLFVFAWELLALAFYVAIAFAGTDPRRSSAAYLTAVITHGAAIGLIAALVLSSRGATFELSMALHTANAASVVSGLAFVLALVAFGAKAGLLPFPVWMARGYTAAPALVAALMAGGALNVAFYGLARFTLGIGGNPPLWWALTLLGCGALAAFFGIAWGAAQRDIRTLAAYSSVENAGIVVIGIGVAVAGRAVHLPLIVGVGLAAALLHATSHAFAKCTIFLGCAELVSRVGSTEFENLGGLWRSLRATTLAVLVAGGSLAALPPTGGFAGEWMTFEALLQAFRTQSPSAEISFALTGAAVGIAAGIAVVAFVKVIGVGFLGAPRTAAARDAMPSRSLGRLIGLLLGFAAVLGTGVAAPQYLALLRPAIDGLSLTGATSAILAEPPVIQPAFAGFSSTWPLGLGLVIAGFALGFALLVALVRRPRGHAVPVWTSGGTYRPWTQYTGTGFVNPTRVVLDAGIRVRRTIAVTNDSGGTGRVTYESETREFFGVPFWSAIGALFLRVADLVRATQSGVIAAYLSYILIFVIVALIAYPAIRHW